MYADVLLTLYNFIMHIFILLEYQYIYIYKLK